VNAGYHVFALDYRGYGDSGGWPSEEGTASDVIALYNVLVKHKPSAKIYFYGHSLGTGFELYFYLKT
jgi:pimeloyl-ACP methyl ester carboxylesterase